jgi:hypothetical protein
VVQFLFDTVFGGVLEVGFAHEFKQFFVDFFKAFLFAIGVNLGEDGDGDGGERHAERDDFVGDFGGIAVFDEEENDGGGGHEDEQSGGESDDEAHFFHML